MHAGRGAALSPDRPFLREPERDGLALALALRQLCTQKPATGEAGVRLTIRRVRALAGHQSDATAPLRAVQGSTRREVSWGAALRPQGKVS